MRSLLPGIALLAVPLIACDPAAGDGKVTDDPQDSEVEGDADADGDADSDTDADSDADSDSDADADTDSDSDTDLQCSGFATTLTEWALPPIVGDFSDEVPWSSQKVEESREVDGVKIFYNAGMFDLNADGLEDLVLTRDGVDPDIGDEYWLVYESNGSGFSTTATKWSLPEIAGDFGEKPPFYSWTSGREREVDGEMKHYSMRLVDLSFDGVEDLVITYDETDLTIGTTHWLVYKAGTSGFSMTPTKWSLPSVSGDFSDTAPIRSMPSEGERDVGGESLYYRIEVHDLTGDGVEDLIFTKDEVDPKIGDEYWLVHEGGASGFSTTAKKLSLPPIAGDDPERGPYSGLSVGEDRDVDGESLGYFASALNDVNGDGANDLVFTMDLVDRAIGTAHWLVYKGSASGFATTPTEWTLPSITGEFSNWPPFYVRFVYTLRDVGSERLFYSSSTMDLSGDGVDDLLITWDQVDPEVGFTHWLVHEGGASGFSPTPTRWSLPSISGDFPDAAPFEYPSRTADRYISGWWYDYRHSTYDITGDGGYDLLITYDELDSDIGTKHWLVYEGLCE